VEERVENTSRDRERASAKIKKEFKESHAGPVAPLRLHQAVINDVMDRPGQQVPVVDSASLAGADKVVSQLNRTLSEIQVCQPDGQPVQTAMAAIAAMAHGWQTAKRRQFHRRPRRELKCLTTRSQQSAIHATR
jgi:hypothetical protein